MQRIAFAIFCRLGIVAPASPPWRRLVEHVSQGSHQAYCSITTVPVAFYWACRPSDDTVHYKCDKTV